MEMTLERGGHRDCSPEQLSRWRPHSRPRARRWRSRPISAMGRGAHETQARLRWGRDLIWSADLAIAALLASFAPAVDGKPLWGYAAALLAIGSAALAAPAFALLLTNLSRNAAATHLRRGRTAGRPRPRRLALAHVGHRRRASDRDRHDGQRRHHGRQLSRNRDRVARPATARRPLRAPGGPIRRRASFPRSRARRRS